MKEAWTWHCRGFCVNVNTSEQLGQENIPLRISFIPASKKPNQLISAPLPSPSLLRPQLPWQQHDCHFRRENCTNKITVQMKAWTILPLWGRVWLIYGLTAPLAVGTNSLIPPGMAMLYAVVTQTMIMLLICPRCQQNWAGKTLCVEYKADGTK